MRRRRHTQAEIPRRVLFWEGIAPDREDDLKDEPRDRDEGEDTVDDYVPDEWDY